MRHSGVTLGSSLLAMFVAGAQAQMAAAQQENVSERLSLAEIIEDQGQVEAIVLFKQPGNESGNSGAAAFSGPDIYLRESYSLSEEEEQQVRSLGVEGAALMPVDQDTLEKLRADETVELIAPNRSHPPAVADAANLAGLLELSSTLAIGKIGDGAGYAIAILDTGFEAEHPFIKGKIVEEACFSRTDPSNGIESLCPGGAEQENGDVIEMSSGAARNCDHEISGCVHGTHIAGVAAGNEIVDPRDPARKISGLARGASIFAI